MIISIDLDTARKRELFEKASQVVRERMPWLKPTHERVLIEGLRALAPEPVEPTGER